MTNVFVWVSRHPLTINQKELVFTYFKNAAEDIQLLELGDVDVFDENAMDKLFMEIEKIVNNGEFPIVGGVHGLLGAICMKEGYPFGVFNNINRSPVGKKPQFETTELRVVYPC